LAVLIALARAAHASDQVGVYALPSAIAFEPDAANPATATRVKVSGWFTIANGPIGSGDQYAAPAMGYVYYACPSGMEATCRMEWTDIRNAADGVTCIGWGSRSLFPTPGNGSVRTSATASSPDAFPLAMGVAHPSNQLAQCPALFAAKGDGGVALIVDMAEPAKDAATGGAADLSHEQPKPSTSGCSSAPGVATGDALLAIGALLLVARARRRLA
jgi:hypothetical protein